MAVRIKRSPEKQGPNQQEFTVGIFDWQVGIEGLTYAGNHGLEILHPDGSRFVHPMPAEFQDKCSNLLKRLQDQVQYDQSHSHVKG